MVIFSYTGSPQVKILQKVLGGLLFLTHTVYQLQETMFETENFVYI